MATLNVSGLYLKKCVFIVRCPTKWHQQEIIVITLETNICCKMIHLLCLLGHSYYNYIIGYVPTPYVIKYYFATDSRSFEQTWLWIWDAILILLNLLILVKILLVVVNNLLFFKLYLQGQSFYSTRINRKQCIFLTYVYC